MTLAGDMLSELQRLILRELAPLEPPFTLVGGAALAGVHLGHRRTRDLDLFWRQQTSVAEVAEEARRRLAAVEAIREVTVLQRSPTFVRLDVRDDRETVVVDLAADPGGPVVPDEEVLVAGVKLRVARRYGILVSKLCALLGRSELRDLVDVRALLAAGEDLESAVQDAPREDMGFSPLTLAWVLEGLAVEGLARATGMSEADAATLAAFKERLVDDLIDLTRQE